MSRTRDYAPVKITCPTIDEVISFIDWCRRKYANEETEKDFKDAEMLMEKIRKDNTELREWGNGEYQRAEDAEWEIIDMNKQYQEVKGDAEYYQQQMKELESGLNSEK